MADIKVAAPDTEISGRLQPNGRLDFQGATMKLLFQIAWDINDDDLLAGAPKWSNDEIQPRREDVVGEQRPEQPQQRADRYRRRRAMLRALLIDRFKIVTHLEHRLIDTYTLVVADKPKLQPADPANRTNWFNGPAPGVKDPRDANPALNRLVTVQNMTMAQFAEDLSAMAARYLKEPVVDATGLRARGTSR